MSGWKGKKRKGKERDMKEGRERKRTKRFDKRVIESERKEGLRER